MKKYIGSKEFFKTVVPIILPIMLQQLFLSLAGYIDNIMINSYGNGPAAYNGVSAANRLMFICNFIMAGVVSAVSIFTSQFFGAKDKEKVKETARLSIYSVLFFSLLAYIAIEFLGKWVVNRFIQDENARSFGYDYLKIMKFGFLFVAIDMAFANILRSIQRPRIPLIIGIVGILVNIFFNYCFIFGRLNFPEMGATGAAIATVISKIVEIILYIITIPLLKLEWLHGFFNKFYISKKLFKDFITRGTPVIMNEVFWSLSMVILTRFYTYNNDIWYNAYSYTQNITDLFFIVFAGLGNGTAILIGASLGRGDFISAERDMYYFKGFAVMLGIGVGVIMAATSPLTCRVFTKDQDVISIMVKIMCITSIFTFIYCYNSVCFFILRAGGDSIRAMVLDQVPTYVIGIPIAIILGVNSAKWGITIVVIYLATHLLDITKIFLSNKFISQRKWLKNLTIDNN